MAPPGQKQSFYPLSNFALTELRALKVSRCMTRESVEVAEIDNALSDVGVSKSINS